MADNLGVDPEATGVSQARGNGVRRATATCRWAAGVIAAAWAARAPVVRASADLRVASVRWQETVAVQTDGQVCTARVTGKPEVQSSRRA